MFLGAEDVLEISFAAARAGLACVADGGRLEGESAQAYRELGQSLVRIGPAGSRRGVSRLVAVHFRDLISRDGCTVLIMRWEAPGLGGDLFPVLDADITLSPYGPGTTLLAVAGAYRPPLGGVGAALDRMVMRRVAEATLQRFVQRLGTALAESAEEPRSA